MNIKDDFVEYIVVASEKYNDFILRRRVIILILSMSIVFFLWYLLWGHPAEVRLNDAYKKNDELIAESKIIFLESEKYKTNDLIEKNISLIENKMLVVNSKISSIDSDLSRFNKTTIDVGDLVLLLRDLLRANDNLSLESLKVLPSEIVGNKSDTEKKNDIFEKNTVAIKLKGDYFSVFDYLKRIESLEWSVFWQDMKYVVVNYPQAVIDIRLYTLSIIEDVADANR